MGCLYAFNLQLIDNKAHDILHYASAPSFAPIITTFALKQLFMGEKIYPFRKAKLQDCDGNLKKRWYVSFYVGDIQKNSLIRKREYSINEYKTKEERFAFAKQRIESVNMLLAEGYHIDSRKQVEEVDELQNVTTLEDALRKILEIKKQSLRRKSYHNFSSTVNDFLGWAKKNRLNQVDINYFDRNHAQRYTDYLIVERGSPGKTVNTKISYLKTLFNCLKERDIVEDSPLDRLKKQKEIKTYQNVAFTEKEIAILKTAIEIEAPILWVFIQFVYYCYIRPGEIRRLKREYIDLSSGKIFIPAFISKNAKDDFVDIPEPFKPVLNKFLADINEKDYIFPGRIKDKTLGEYHMTRIHKSFLIRFGFDDRHTLYSWKHTGIVMAYKAGVDIKSIQRQCRHHSIEMTDNYLKSLGLYNNEAFLMKMPSL